MFGLAKRFLTISAIFILAAILIVGVWYGWGYWNLRTDFMIQGVPFSGQKSAHGEQYLYTGQNRGTLPIGLGSPGAAMLMVAGYWHLRDNSQPLLLPKDVLAKLPMIDPKLGLNDIARYAQELGFQARLRPAPLGVTSLGTYTNTRRPTPIIVEQDLSKDFPGKGKIFRVVVGIENNAQTVIVHDYVYGPLHKISAEDFNALWRTPKQILVIEPVNRSQADANQPGFTYVEYFGYKEVAEIRTYWYLAEEARLEKRTADAIDYWEKVVHHPQFSQGTRDGRLYHLNSLLFLYLDQKRYQDIVNFEQDLLTLNKTEQGAQEDPALWVLIGEGNLGLGDKAKARFYAEKALAVKPGHNAAVVLMEKAK